ncbi:contractile injection system tape measure protein [Tenacibaculum salmonis]|uniref:contractile injection system tape measure protein n=1 Tax=Tenacibaculum sp. P3-BQ1 TaxID=3232310 RepID=UPI0034DE60C3
MKDNQTHIIKSQQYEIELNDSSEGYLYQSKISQLQEHSIQSILQKVMDRYHITEYLDEYDKITLDLGSISASNFERELTYKIEEAFINFFKNNTYDNGTLIKGNRRSIYKTQVDQFVFFLKNGYMQWDTPSATKPIELLKEALKNNKEALITALKKEGKKENIRKRLISQLKDPVLEQIVLAVKEEEGVFINQSRSDIVAYQNNFALVEINKNYFRSAIWEIVLAYVFTEVSGQSNQKNFLKYLIHKIASKYNLTYQALLKNIVLGIQKSQNKVNRIPSFARIAIQLQEEINVNEVSIKSNNLDFETTFRYFLKNNTLPIDSVITEKSFFIKEIKAFIHKDTSKFYAIFFQFIKEDTSNVIRFVNKFSEELLKYIITNTTEKILVNILVFFKKIKELSNKKLIKSITLNKLDEKIGEISLKTFSRTHLNSNDAIKEFLFQIINETVIDEAFIDILKSLSKDKSIESYKVLLLFINDFIPKNIYENVIFNEVYQPSFSKYSIKLYSYYQNKKNISLKEFQVDLKSNNYKEVSLKLITVMLEVFSRNKNCSDNILAEWIEKRLDELHINGKEIRVILNEITIIIKKLEVDFKIYQAVLKSEELINYKKKQKLISSEYESIDAVLIPENAYQELVLNIKKIIFTRKQKSLQYCVEELLKSFSEKYNIDKNDVLKILKKRNIIQNIPEFIALILEDISNNQQKIFNNNDKVKYHLNLTHFFIVKGALPWWANNKSSVSLLKSMYEVLNLYPDKFVFWFKKAKNQQVIINLLDDKNYEVFLTQINPSSSQNIITIKLLFDSVLQKDISGIKNILPKHRKELRYFFLQYIQRNQQVDTSKLIVFIVVKLSEMIVLSKENLYLLILERIKYDKPIFKNLKKVENWLEGKVLQPVFKYKNQIEKIEKEIPWNEAIFFSNSKEVFETLKIINQENFNELAFQLKKPFFRNKIINKLSIKYQKEVSSLFFSVTNQSTLFSVFEIFSKLKKQFSVNKYNTIWCFFIDRVLLKIALLSTEKWSVNDWSLLIFESVNSIKNTNITEIITAVSVSNNIPEKIVADLKKLTIQKQKETKEELVIEVIENETVEGTIFIENAGMILLGPYISMLFERIGLIENKAFKNDECQQKAIYMLQYAVTGKTESEEQVLLLNKIICGMDIHIPLGFVVTLSTQEKDLVDSLLKAIITHWSAIGNTSVDGFRVSFLCRSGSIIVGKDTFILTVEEKSYDMLLDQIPWSIGQLKLSWMEKLIDITWRANK